MLVKNKIANLHKAFLKKVNSAPVKDQDAAIQQYCEQVESLIYTAIKDMTITIPVGKIIVLTSSGPAANTQPIVLQNNKLIKTTIT